MSLTVKMEAIHSGITKNFNRYSREELEKAIQTWIGPYGKPVIVNHNIYSDPLGRVTESSIGRSHLKRGSYCVELTCSIIDEEAQKKIADGRYSTVSVGTIINRAVCSICKTDWATDYCEHRKGKVYDGKLCYWDLGIDEHYEVSFVNHPADPYARVVSADESSTGESVGTISRENPNRQDERKDDQAMDKLAKDIVDAFNSDNIAENTNTGQESQAEAPDTKQESPELDILKTEVESLKQNLAQLTSQLNSAVEKHNLLAQQNAELARVIHQEMVEHYCDLVASLGLFENREEAEQKAKEFDVALLRKEIVKLSAQVGQRRTESVPIPGGEGRSVEKPVESTQDGNKEYTIKDLEDALSRLFGSKNG